MKGLKEIILVVAEGEQEYMSNHIKGWICISCKDSIWWKRTSRFCGIWSQSCIRDSNIVLVHDGARPLASTKLFDSVVRAAIEYRAATVGVPATDTIKRVNTEHTVIETLKRSELYQIQTPQGFPKKIYLKRPIKRLMTKNI